MNYILIFGAIVGWVLILLGCCLGWQLLGQNGRILLRLETLEKQFDKPEAGAREIAAGLPLDSHVPESGAKEWAGNDHATAPQSQIANPKSGNNDEGRANRFGNRSLARSRLKRDGLKAGTAAPEFCLPRLEGGELSLAELRGRMVLLVFSSPHCGPCNTLAPRLEEFHRLEPDLEVLMVSRGEAGENRDKVKEHGLTFTVVLQKQWEVSREYAMFATPVAYLIDQAGVITADVAVGGDAIEALMARAKRLLHQDASPAKPS